MHALKDIPNRIYASPSGRFFTALLLVIALFFASLFFTNVTYYHNDDTNIAFALAGYLSGEPYPAHPFINCLLANAVSFFYRLLPAVPWWLVIQLAFSFLGIAVTGSCILEVSYSKKLPFLAALLLYGVYALGFALYTLLLVTFTLTAAILGAAAVSLLLCANETWSPRRRALSYAAAAALMALAFLFRNSSGLSLLAFFFGAIVYRFASFLLSKADKKRYVRLTVFTAASLALFISLVAVNRWGLSHYNTAEFPAFDEARGRYLDYPVDSYSDNPSLYESVGWDKELYSMVRQWFYMDARVTADSLNSILNGSVKGGFISPDEALNDLKSLFSTQPIFTCMLAASVLLFALFAAAGRKRGEGGLALLFALFMLLGGGVLSAYLLFSGRLVLRVFQLIAIPTGASVLLLGLLAVQTDHAQTRSFEIKKVVCGCLLAGLLFCAAKCVRITVGYDSTELLKNSRAVIDYVLSHPNSVFIRDTRAANNVDAVSVYPDRKPTNLIDWGGTSAYTGAKQLQLAQYDLLPFTADVFFREDVFLITEPDSRDYKSFLSYMNAKYGGVSLVLTEAIVDGAAVYRVIREPLEGTAP